MSLGFLFHGCHASRIVLLHCEHVAGSFDLLLGQRRLLTTFLRSGHFGDRLVLKGLVDDAGNRVKVLPTFIDRLLLLLSLQLSNLPIKFVLDLDFYCIEVVVQKSLMLFKELLDAFIDLLPRLHLGQRADIELIELVELDKVVFQIVQCHLAICEVLLNPVIDLVDIDLLLVENQPVVAPDFVDDLVSMLVANIITQRQVLLWQAAEVFCRMHIA